MDIKEIENIHANRHPWETARLKALYKIIRPYLFDGIRILDIGCGDGFVSRELFNTIRTKDITAVDINLTDSQIFELGSFSREIRYFREIPDKGEFDLLLLLDVLEHLEDDVGFLSTLVTRYLSTGSRVMLTVPAFQSIYGLHDRNLGHYRRYTLSDMESLVKRQGLRIITSGYLFASLLLPKYLLCTIFKIDRYSKGVGRWTGGKFLTGMIETLLNIDNSILLSFSRTGIKIPGLTGWVLCEKLE